MNVLDSAEEVSFRAEVRAWLSENTPAEPRPHIGGPAQRDFDRAWRRRQSDGGWGHIAWPVEYGGRGLALPLQLIWYEECARAHTPDHIDMYFVALQHAGPTLIARGTQAQQSYHLPRILSGESIWCQGFSEPGAGSDLASIRTRGVVEDDAVVVTGQKIWTSFGCHAHYQELLVRTDPQSSRHAGLTWLICDMRTPGIEVRPIRNLVGDDDFCEVFYDDVRIPLANVVGGVGNGWDVAMSTLGFERGTASVPQMMELGRHVEELRELAGRYGAVPGTMERLAFARAEVAALRAMIYLGIARDRQAANPGSQGSLIRLRMTELAQRISRIAMEILGAVGLERGAENGWPRRYLIDFKHTIAGGTSEIQRNIIGERGLGLPRGRKA